MHAALDFQSVSVRFGDYPALDGVNFTAAAGRFVAVVGPSGCGKTTLLNLAAGLVLPTAGAVAVDGPVAYLFQQDALFPWKTVLENVAFGLQVRGRQDAEELARHWIARVGLREFEYRFPAQLSGGQRKRVAIAQNWIVERPVLLMDEPFSALDVHTRAQMESELLGLWAESRQTVLLVTHDLEEAITLADEVLVLSAGPASRVVARYEVPLERPRNVLDLRTTDEFSRLYRMIWHDLRAEVVKSHAR